MITLLKKILKFLGFELLRIKKFNDDTILYIKLYGDESVKKRRFYNISAGACKGFGGGINHPCWTNIDVDKKWSSDPCFPDGAEYDPRRDIAHDLLSMKPLPVESDSAELVHSRFTVDRLTDEAALFFFKETHRILKKNGTFRIVSTDLDLDYRAYINKDKNYFFWLGDDFSIEQAFLYHVVTQVSTHYHDAVSIKITDQELRSLLQSMTYEDALTYCASRSSLEIHKQNRYDHFNWWNRKKFEKTLGLAGFKTIYLSAPEQSASPVMRNELFFDNDHLKVMMYMEAVK